MPMNVNAKTRKEEQIQHYYPFGLPLPDSATIASAAIQPYKYNAKELDRMHGLTWYDYGARMYDPQLCRFTTPDRFADKAPWQSVYAYPNNPVSCVDVNGDSIDYGMNRQGEIFKIGDNDFEEDRIFSSVTSSSTQVSDLYNSKGELRSRHQVYSFKHSDVRISKGVYNRNKNYTQLVSRGDMSDFFKFVADNTSVEWSYFRTLNENSTYSADFVTTSHKFNSENYGSLLVNKFTNTQSVSVGYRIVFHKHSHPYHFDAESENSNIEPSTEDWKFYNELKMYYPDAQIFIRNRGNEKEYYK